MESSKNPTTQKLLEAFDRIKKVNWHQSPVEGVTFSELQVMFCVKRETEKDALGVKISEISNSLKVAPPTITQSVNSLESGGYVRRNLDKEDRRAVRITLTEKGEETIAKAKASFYEFFEGLVNYLGDEKSNELAEILNKAFSYFKEKKE